jgi:hypothetical protein
MKYLLRHGTLVPLTMVLALGCLVTATMTPTAHAASAPVAGVQPLTGPAGPLQPPAAALQPTGAPSSGYHSLGFVPSAAPSPRHSPKLLTPMSLLPSAVDLSQYNPPVGNQGNVNSCTSWATDYYLRGYYAKRGGYYPPSTRPDTNGGFAPMYLYAQIVRGQNVGTTFGANLSLLQQQGIDSRADYYQGDDDYTDQPTASERANASHDMIASYYDVSGSNLQNWIETSIANGNPVAIGIPIYPNFDAANSTNYYVDVPTSGTSRGNHAVYASKYDANGLWIENQWGTGW